MLAVIGTVFLALLALCYVWVRERRYRFWADRSVAFIEPQFPYGNFKTLGKVEHIAPITQRHYDHFKRLGVPYGGVFMLTTPLLYIFDTELIKTLLVKDFQYFPNRGVYFNERDDPLSAHMFAIEGQKWRTLRTKLSPTFTSGRIRTTLPLVIEVCRRFRDHPLVVYLMKAFRGYANRLGMKQLHDDVSRFFLGVVRDTVELREREKIVRNDFMDLLLKLKNTGRLEDGGEQIGHITFEEIAAQAFIFFTAGYDTSSTAMTYTLYELALNQAAQEKARACVRETMQKYDGQLTYEALSNMPYLEQCINETLRKHPPVAILERNADKDYRIPNSALVLRRGQKVMIPIYAMHHDPDHFPEPEEYRPERFSPEEVAKRDPHCYLPFGEGPRICIGMRFGSLQAKAGLASLLDTFRFSVCPQTQIPVQYSRTNFILGPANGVHLRVELL
ncbi:probable cytochrome P450 6a17 [Anopheles cruzii]|uniref:probable cytochrome P450 6a17 n=1 Tax=Anopheles cruzii TaxID=68878 RepID=UPI0022EC3B05|nr:probable cytochrome P450 6a17 [Anopheles cruzii]